METKGRFLVNTEGASSFMELATTETGGKAFLGDAEQYDSQVGPDITAAHITLRDAANKVAALVEDPTFKSMKPPQFWQNAPLRNWRRRKRQSKPAPKAFTTLV